VLAQVGFDQSALQVDVDLRQIPCYVATALNVERVLELRDDRLSAHEIVVRSLNVLTIDRVDRAGDEARRAAVQHHDQLAWSGGLGLRLAVHVICVHRVWGLSPTAKVEMSIGRESNAQQGEESPCAYERGRERGIPLSLG